MTDPAFRRVPNTPTTHGAAPPRRWRVFLGPIEVAGYYTNLQRGLEARGCRVLRADLEQDWRRYTARPDPLLARLATAAGRRGRRVANSDTGSRWRRAAWSKLQSLLQWALLVQAVASCDVFVYSFGSTITWYPNAELSLLRRLRKRIIFVHHGSDTRPPYLDGQVIAYNRGESLDRCAAMAAETKARIELHDRFADFVIDNPMSSHFHTRPCVNWHVIGIPAISPDTSQTPPRAPNAAVRVLHSPSHPETKGTPLIRDAVARLQARGRAIEYVEVIGQPHAVVLAELARCDLVVDQAYSDVPMAGFPTEAAAFGKPAVVGGLGVDLWEECIPPSCMPPILACHPDDIEGAIDRLVTDSEFRDRLGREAQAFVRSHRDAGSVAERYLRMFAGDVPEEWLFDPARISYAGGCGSPVTIRRTVREVVDRFGLSALQLDDKPELRDRIVAFAAEDASPVSAHAAS